MLKGKRKFHIFTLSPAPFSHNAKKSIDSAQVAILCFGNSTSVIEFRQ